MNRFYKKPKPETMKKNREIYADVFIQEIKWFKENLQTLTETKNKFMIEFHDLQEDENNIRFVSLDKTYDWNLLKKEFMEMEFNSIIGKEKTWDKYIKTFDKLERNCYAD